MKSTTFLLFLLASFGCNSADRPTGACSNRASQLTYTQITEPVYLENNERVVEIQRKSFELDIDHDGVPETFVEHPLTRGNAGLNHTVYRRHGDRFERLGELFFHPAAFRVLPATEEHPIRVIRYWRSNASEGSLETLGYRGNAFVVLASETIYPGDGGTDEGRKRYAELFEN